MVTPRARRSSTVSPGPVDGVPASVRRLPIVDDGELTGIVTLDDLNRLLVQELGTLAGVVVGESPPY